VSENGLVSLISETYQKIENGKEYNDIEKSVRSVGPRFEAPIESDSLAIERIERRKDLGTGDRRVRKPLTIRLEDIEKLHRKHNYLG
jgi:hypothetical protein